MFGMDMYKALMLLRDEAVPRIDEEVFLHWIFVPISDDRFCFFLIYTLRVPRLTMIWSALILARRNGPMTESFSMRLTEELILLMLDEQMPHQLLSLLRYIG